jgi:hypothetical protein
MHGKNEGGIEGVGQWEWSKLGACMERKRARLKGLGHGRLLLTLNGVVAGNQQSLYFGRKTIQEQFKTPSRVYLFLD